MFSFTGRNILVTGAGSGIGKATALALGQQGGSLIVVDRNQEIEPLSNWSKSAQKQRLFGRTSRI